MSIHKKALLAAAASLCCSAGASAQTQPSKEGRSPAEVSAQDPGEANPASTKNAVQTIMVTAERRLTPLQETPIAITALTAEMLTERGINNVFDIASTVPNLSIVQSSSFGGGSTLQAYIRGIGAADYLFPNDPGVGLYIDGVYVARTMGGLQALTDVERVEVLKGPQGTLFGRNTIGGAISITTTQPKLKGATEADVELRVGSFSRKDVVAKLNMPLVPETLGFKLSAARLQADGFGQQLTTGLDLGDENKTVVRGALRLAATKDLEFTLSADYSEQRQHGPAGGISEVYPASVMDGLYNPVIAPTLNAGLGLPADAKFDQRYFTGTPNPRDNYATGPSYDRFKISGVTLNALFRPSDAVTLRSITAYRDMRSQVSVDADGSPNNIFTHAPTETSKQFSQEFQLNGDTMGKRLNYLVGAYYSKERATDVAVVDIYAGAAAAGLPFLSLSQIANTAIKVESFALFTEERLKLGGDMTLIVGGRYTKDKKVYDKGTVLTELGNAPLVAPTQLSGTFSAFTPKIGLDWKPVPSALLYGTYSEGFKSGGWNSRDNNTDTRVGDTPFKPEHAKSLELGLKADWLDKRLRTNLAVFTTKYKDMQLTTLFLDPVTGGPTSTIENGGDSRISGFEAEITAVPTDGLTVNLNVARLNAKYLSISPNAVRTGITVQDKLANISPTNVSASATYEFEAGSAGTVRLTGGASYRSKLYFDNLNSEAIAQGGYTLVNARVSFVPAGVPKLELALSGTNLSDKAYRIASFLGVTSGYNYVYIGRPREVQLSAKYNF